MEVSTKRAAESAKSGSPKKQRIAKKAATAKNKKPRDVNKPKRPMSAYFFFLEWFRNDLKQKKKDGEDTPTKIGDVAKLAGERWKKMTSDDKKPFVVLNEKAKKAYEEQVQLIKPARDENKPKKPRTAFFFFLEEFREKKKDSEDGKKIPSLAGEEWRAMDDVDKKPYTDKAAVAKKDYDEQMKIYNATNPKKPAEKVPVKKSKAVVKEDSESDDDDDDEENDDDDEEEEEDDDEDSD